MPVFSSGRDAVFTPTAKIRFQVDHFPDFYALLGVERDACDADLESAITTRGADLLAASFSRGGKGEFLTLLERHMTDFRDTLLDRVVRLAYDEQLRRHENGDSRALEFAVWKDTYLVPRSALSRNIHKASRGLKDRFKSVFWDSEYF